MPRFAETRKELFHSLHGGPTLIVGYVPLDLVIFQICQSFDHERCPRACDKVKIEHNAENMSTYLTAPFREDSLPCTMLTISFKADGLSCRSCCPESAMRHLDYHQEEVAGRMKAKKLTSQEF